jgi:protein ImuB
VVAVTPELLPHIYPGLSVAEAKARNSDIISLPITPADDFRSLEALGRWLIKFSPDVSLYPPCSIFLDATGLERLFGGLHNLHNRVSQAFAALRISAGISIAPTPGAAWALAAYSHNPPPIVLMDQLREAIAPLPARSLRLSARTVEQLRSLGIHTIGNLLKLHREELAIRFGAEILQRIDQMLGTIDEPLIFLEHHTPVRAALEFEGAVESIEAIHMVIGQLVEQVVDQMTRRNLGAREIQLIFRRPYALPVEKRVRLTRPCRNTRALINLLQCALEMLETDEGFIAIELSVPTIERLGHQQSLLIGTDEEHGDADLDHLIERLQARLDHSVEWVELAESHVPERAYKCLQEQSGPQKVETAPVTLFRPLRLLPQPRPLKVIVMPCEALDGKPVSFTDAGTAHRLVNVRGPERITGEWWTGQWKTRDYYDVLDTAGGRYWIFRVGETRRWFLHGIFE